MRLLYIVIILVAISCSEVIEDKDIDLPKAVQSAESNKETQIKVEPFNVIADNFIYREFGEILKSKNSFKFQPFSNITRVKEVLISALPASELKVWITDHKEAIEKEDWLQIKPICQAKKDSTLLYFLTTSEQVSGEGETYADYWCLTSQNGKTISKVTHLGISGYYPRIDTGEEEGAEYWIKTIEEEEIVIEIHKPDSIVTKITSYTLREGHDWRVDQNLKINDSVAMPEVIHIFNAL